MKQQSGSTQRPLGNADLARVLSPLLLFVAHVLYLVFWSRDSFFNKWVDGSFSFFLALVLCNIVRARVVAAAGPGEERGDETHARAPGAHGADEARADGESTPAGRAPE